MTLQPRQGNGRPDGRPLCWNAKPMPEGYVANDGYDEFGQLQRVVIPWPFSRECRSWASSGGTDPVPLAEGWRCDGCQHFPHALHDAAIEKQRSRA
ncbi:MAG: hypothetical protein ACRC2H_00985 [Silanimonas sp.]